MKLTKKQINNVLAVVFLLIGSLIALYFLMWGYVAEFIFIGVLTYVLFENFIDDEIFSGIGVVSSLARKFRGPVNNNVNDLQSNEYKEKFENENHQIDTLDVIVIIISLILILVGGISILMGIPFIMLSFAGTVFSITDLFFGLLFAAIGIIFMYGGSKAIYNRR